MNTTIHPAEQHRLCFGPLQAAGSAYFIRCDAAGRVDLDGLDRRERLEYLYARALVGRDFDRPCVVVCTGSAR